MVERRRPGRRDRGHRADRAARHHPAARPRLPSRGDHRSLRRLHARAWRPPPAPRARRRRGGGGGGGAARRGRAGRPAPSRPTLSALAKLDQVLPANLRERVAAIAAVTVGLRAPGVPEVDVDRLVAAESRLPTPRAAPLHLRRRGGSLDRTPRRALPARLHRAVLVPRRLRPVARGLAHVPGRPHVRAAPDRSALRRRIDDPPDAGELVSRGSGGVGLRPAGRGAPAAARGSRPGASSRRPSGSSRPSPTRPAWSGSAATPTGSPGTSPVSRCTFEVVDGDEVKAELRALGRRLVRQHR